MSIKSYKSFNENKGVSIENYISREKDNKSSYEMYNELKNMGYSIEELTEFFHDFDQDGNPIKK
jgi:hypothetical protein